MGLDNDLIILEMAWNGFKKTWEDFKKHEKVIFKPKVKVWLRKEKDLIRLEGLERDLKKSRGTYEAFKIQIDL